ncbi:hypothetical protein APE_1322a [Aeropyrum pernix K1]|uniref:Uncharacterized protein n=1 Tax=Aeropyrum pernix (strain ATCC 700893 / DSM 11879 / JCM 9820 / NBRC 100138 / K1) TaxID=272557 RepID=Q9YCD4_AERPE|nr:hypothetical protein [Aeropyrum pernix]BAA80314.1 hypothetical protein APE_1322a [Aeropyrum pernix K1]
MAGRILGHPGSGKSFLGGLVLAASGIVFFGISVYTIYQGSVAASLLSAAIGLVLVSLGADMMMRES